MIYKRLADERGKVAFDWLSSFHTFSFGSYYDPNHMGFSSLKVINEDTVAPSAGFEKHGHRDMEILSIVLEGSIVHQDSLGHKHEIPAGDIQLMSAGTGIYHSEFNGSDHEPLKFLQIWIQPEKVGVPPSYQQKSFTEIQNANETASAVSLLVSPDGQSGSLKINQQTYVSKIELSELNGLSLPLRLTQGYLHVMAGNAEVQGHRLQAGDGLGISELETLGIESASSGFTAIWFDLM